MSGDFDALFDTFAHTAYRLETLPAYAIPREDASYRAFLDGTPRPERSVRTSPWMRRLAVTTTAGKVWTRTRVHDTPLTDYQRFQMPAYLESQTVGDSTSFVDRARVGDLGPDFWLFDHGTDHCRAAVMRYSPTGEFLGFDLVTDPHRLDEMARVRDHAQDGAVPLAEFVVGLDRVAHG